MGRFKPSVALRVLIEQSDNLDAEGSSTNLPFGFFKTDAYDPVVPIFCSPAFVEQFVADHRALLNG
jgi:hypothetical protein